jgi:hypothetical protein
MTYKSLTSLAFAAGCALALGAMPSAHAQTNPQQQPTIGPQPEMVTNGPQASAGDFGDWSARQNVIESAHYDRLLETNMAFRSFRERKECGPIGDPQLRDQCLASFEQFEPAMYGSSMAPRWHHRYHENSGY